MKIQQIQETTNFGKTRRFVTPQMLDDIEVLLFKMNQETQYIANDYYFNSTVLKRLKYKNKAEFIDGRTFLAPAPQKEQKRGNTLFTIGKTELVINNENGEIVDYYKPFYVMWSKVMKNISKYLDIFKNNFDDTSAIDKFFLKISGFTEKGFERLNELKGQ